MPEQEVYKNDFNEELALERVFLTAVKENFSPNDCIRLNTTYLLARACYSNKFRDSTEIFLSHPHEVALILMNECSIKNPDIIELALLHDVIEESFLFELFIEETNDEMMDRAYEFLHKNITDISFNKVAAITRPKVDCKTILNKQQANEIYENNLIESVEKLSPDVLLVKMADDLHNAKTLEPRSREKKISFIKKNRKYYFNIFERLKDSEYKNNYEYLIKEIKNEIQKAIDKFEITEDELKEVQ